MLGLQAAGGVDQHQISALGLGGADGVKHHRRRIGISRGVGHHGDTAALTPDRHLLHSRGAEGVGGGDQAAVAAAHGEIGQLAEGGGFAHPVHTHHQPHIEATTLRRQQLSAAGLDWRIEQGLELLLEEADTLGRLHHFFVEALAQGIEHLIGGLHTHIGTEQEALEIVKHLGGEGIVAEVVEQLGDKTATGFLHATPQPAEPIDLLQGDVVELAALGGKHLRRPGEVVVEGTELWCGLVGGWRCRRSEGRRGPRCGWRRRRRGTHRLGRLDGALQQLLLPLGPLGCGLLQQGESWGLRCGRNGWHGRGCTRIRNRRPRRRLGRQLLYASGGRR